LPPAVKLAEQSRKAQRGRCKLGLCGAQLLQHALGEYLAQAVEVAAGVARRSAIQRQVRDREWRVDAHAVGHLEHHLHRAGEHDTPNADVERGAKYVGVHGGVLGDQALRRWASMKVGMIAQVHHGFAAFEQAVNGDVIAQIGEHELGFQAVLVLVIGGGDFVAVLEQVRADGRAELASGAGNQNFHGSFQGF
jgi:hypothetical protein